MPMIGLMPGGRGLAVEVVGAEHVAVVGHRERRHAQRGGLGEQVVEPGGAVEHGVLGVHVQVDERVAVPVPTVAALPLAARSPILSPATDDGRRPARRVSDLWYRLMGGRAATVPRPVTSGQARQSTLRGEVAHCWDGGAGLRRSGGDDDVRADVAHPVQERDRPQRHVHAAVRTRRSGTGGCRTGSAATTSRGSRTAARRTGSSTSPGRCAPVFRVSDGVALRPWIR